jgi:hypothetical protein
VKSNGVGYLRLGGDTLKAAHEHCASWSTASSRSPITIVRDVVRALLAAPVRHYYSLLHIGRVYHDARLPEAMARF